MVEIPALDDVDRGLLHALQLDGRASFAAVAQVLGTSESTVARRYRRLRAAGALRVVGGTSTDQPSWTVRLRCTPDAATALAAALARRPDTFWVHVLSGGTEISCFVQARDEDARDSLLLAKLPRTNRVLEVTAHLMLEGFTGPGEWRGLAWLRPDQVEALRPAPPPAPAPVAPADADRDLLAALAQDGRTSYAELAGRTGWSESTVKRRLEHLRAQGVLRFQLEVPHTVLGFHAEARLWLSVRPAALVAVATALAGHPEVQFAAVTTGPTNLMASVVCRDSRELYRYLTERIASLPDVDRLESAPVLRTVKRTGAV
ncbi:DNA-binding Lrp family transcriptional regulator [Crossiella equi]|uniref:DNA-binding Lrp family transcriptional regulator n=1 Tax=Crossiella equi TaxID=130796 RepID=A0ABS5AR01_9PSEU|nr:AsnC family transcriptional regulator [Crossiella equi]MBP2478985.1 DNA-binding Lrp family transcriptional regulator [Crossiella equi]